MSGHICYKGISMINVLKFQTLFSFCSEIKCGVSGLEYTKLLVRLTNSEDPDQTASKQSDLGLHCLSRLFGWQLVFEILECFKIAER